jgi:hypothetical protein
MHLIAVSSRFSIAIKAVNPVMTALEINGVIVRNLLRLAPITGHL